MSTMLFGVPMEVVRDDEKETQTENAVPDRRQNPWTDPRFLVQLGLIIIGIAVATQVRTAGLETAATNLNEKAARIELQVGAISNSVQLIATQSAEMREKLAAQALQIQDLKQSLQMQEARVIVLEKGLARAEARADR